MPITAGRFGLRRLEIDQSVRGVDGKRFLVSTAFMAGLL
jgi:hypothetical protein